MWIAVPVAEAKQDEKRGQARPETQQPFAAFPGFAEQQGPEPEAGSHYPDPRNERIAGAKLVARCKPERAARVQDSPQPLPNSPAFGLNAVEDVVHANHADAKHGNDPRGQVHQTR